MTKVNTFDDFNKIMQSFIEPTEQITSTVCTDLNINESDLQRVKLIEEGTLSEGVILCCCQ